MIFKKTLLILLLLSFFSTGCASTRYYKVMSSDGHSTEIIEVADPDSLKTYLAWGMFGGVTTAVSLVLSTLIFIRER